MSKLFLRVGVLAFGNCDLARMPWSGDMTTLDPQPLPPKVYGDGRILRR